MRATENPGRNTEIYTAHHNIKPQNFPAQKKLLYFLATMKFTAALATALLGLSVTALPVEVSPNFQIPFNALNSPN